MIIGGFALFPITYFHDEGLRLLAEQEEYTYMKDTYNLPDHMDEYLDYLKVNNFEEYLVLKSVHEEIHSYDTWSPYLFVSLLLVLSGFMVLIVGASFRE
jgi:hypothetical protein